MYLRLPRQRQMPGWVVISLAILVAMVAATSAIALLHYADHKRSGEVLLGRFQAFAYQLDSILTEAEAERGVSPALQAQATTIHTGWSATLREFGQVTRDQATTARLQNLMEEYEAALESTLALYQRGDWVQANQTDLQRVDPVFANLNLMIARESAAYRQAAREALVLADVGIVLTIMLAGALLSLLIWRYDEVRRTADLLATEQRALRLSEERFRSLVRNASDVFVIYDRDANMTYISPAAERVWGYPTESVIGERASNFIHLEDQPRARELFATTLAHPGKNHVAELRVRYSDGSYHHCEIIMQNLMDDPGVQGVVANCRDITERKAFEQQLAHQAFHDSLTGLPNRVLFMDRLSQALVRNQRLNRSAAVMFLDLDNFKVINDSLGHHVGDQLLLTAAARIRSCIRSEDTAARIGGDEFTILLEQVEDAYEAIHVAELIQAQLREPCYVAGHEIFTSASIGITLSDRNDEADGLLRDADTAMYRAKHKGKACHELYDRSMNQDMVERLELETDLRYAVERGEFQIYYQPIIAMDTGRITDVEALVRWCHPRRGIISPAEFIPLAEETGLILPIGQWVLAEACREAQRWEDQTLHISVNLSARQFQYPWLVQDVADILQETELNPARLKLEITESIMMTDSDQALATLQQLKELGVALAIDDFGTGYSSLNYLKRFPINVLKIDRAFIERLGQSPEDHAIVHAIITMAKTLNLIVTGEGVETEEQLQHLKLLGCDRGQGYYFGRPLTQDQLAERLALQNTITN